MECDDRNIHVVGEGISCMAGECKEFTFASETKCFPASKCGGCSYTFKDAASGLPGTKDFGDIRCDHHNLFYSERAVT